MRNKIEVTEGQKYGKLTIIKEVSPIGSKRRILCKCDCGNIKEYSMDRVIHGRTQSCGCLRKEMFLIHRNNKGYAIKINYGKYGTDRQRCISSKNRK